MFQFYSSKKSYIYFAGIVLAVFASLIFNPSSSQGALQCYFNLCKKQGDIKCNGSMSQICTSAPGSPLDWQNGVDCASLGQTCVNGQGCVAAVCIDTDGDGYGILNNCPPKIGANDRDCNDSNPLINPGVIEKCDGIDNNCNGQIDEGLAIDNDNDGFSPLGSPCMLPGLADCNDNDANIKPGAEEVCDGKDNNCAGGIDEGCDDDSDDFCEKNKVVTNNINCPKTIGALGDDCDDGKNFVYPGGTETCDLNDNNCNGQTDEGCDEDGDEYCSATMKVYNNSMCTKSQAGGADGNDCNDANGNINPGAVEGPSGAANCSDGVDNDCKNGIDGADNACKNTCNDVDGDGYGAPGNVLCSGGAGTDCAPTDPLIYPGVAEICDNKDNNCDGTVDNGLTGANNSKTSGICAGSKQKCQAGIWKDDYSTVAGYESTETLCDGIDNDCDGSVDNGLISPDNTNQKGVCAGSKKICTGATGWQDKYDASIPNYENPETSCGDGKDNDCDGSDSACCGNNNIEAAKGETCDPPNTIMLPDNNQCRSSCTFCGDGNKDSGAFDNEQCDDGINNDDRGKCTILCQDTVCGDKIIQNQPQNASLVIEQCDNGKQCDNGTTDCITNADCAGIGTGACKARAGDGCDLNCQVESAMAWVDTRDIGPAKNRGMYAMPSGMLDLASDSYYRVCQFGGYPTPTATVNTDIAKFECLPMTVSGAACNPLRLKDVSLVGGNVNWIDIGFTPVAGSCPVNITQGDIGKTCEKKPNPTISYLEKVECEPTSVSIGSTHVIGINKLGRLWSVGNNNNGKLGMNNETNYLDAQPKFIPSVPGFPIGWKKIESGTENTIALASDGSIWAWGDCSTGCGITGVLKQVVPAKIGSDNNWIKISNYDNTGYAIKANGELYSWGNNTYGQLGGGSGYSAATPKKVGLDSDWVEVAAGGDHVLALKNNGTLWGWGRNNYGQAGQIANTDVPQQIGGLDNWVAIAAGGSHSMALNNIGEVYTWGWNNFGQLGDGTTNLVAVNQTPGKVSNLPGVVKIAAGDSHCLVLGADGFIYGWGYNGYGQLGLNNTTNQNWATKMGAINTWAIIEARGVNSSAIQKDGTVWIWGFRNNFGNIGDLLMPPPSQQQKVPAQFVNPI